MQAEEESVIQSATESGASGTNTDSEVMMRNLSRGAGRAGTPHGKAARG